MRVLADYLRMEVDSLTLPTKQAAQLLADIKRLGDRYERVLEQDAAYWRRRDAKQKAAR